MKSINVQRFLGFILLTSFVLTAASCKKILDKLIKDPHATVDGCRIEKIVQWDSPSSDPRTYLFTYNSAGYPVSAISDRPATGAPNFYFWYDSKNRLTDYIELFDNNQYQSWKKYTYNHHGRVIRDTTWTFGTFGAQPDPNSYYIIVSDYSYDSYGRISEVNSVELQPLAGSTYSNSYTYDASGNLEIGYASYDNKINVNRTHKLWMFLNRNYSVNQAPPADAYNSNMLGTKFVGPGIFNFLGVIMENSEFTYSCD